MRAYKEIISYEQNFKAVVRDEAQSISFMRLQGEINAKLLANTHNNLYISDRANLKPLQQHTIDKNISITKKLLNISDNEKNLPLIVIAGDGELPGDVTASFNPIDNILRIHEGLGNRLKIPELQKSSVAPNNPASTYVHELLHWKDAEEYRKTYSEITKENYANYNIWLNKKAEKQLDKLAEQGYNIHKIRDYASQMLERGRGFETYTEYRTKKILKEV